MIRKTFSLLSGLLILSLIVLGAFSLSRTSFRQSLAGTTFTDASAEATPASEAYLPIVVSNTSIDLNASDIITPPNESQVNEEYKPLEPEPFNIIPYHPDPLPSFDPVSPELDNIKFNTIARLEFPKGEYQFLGNISWSPDSNRFVGEYFAVVEGKEINQLYVGDVSTGKVSLWREKGSYPVWGRDNDSILYIKVREDVPLVDLGNGLSRNRYDLFSGQVDSAQDDILLENVLPPYLPLQQHVQTSEGKILALDTQNQFALFPSPSDLIGFVKQGIQPLPIANLSEIIGLPQYPRVSMVDKTAPAFSINADGTKAIFKRLSQPGYLIDIVGGKLEGQIDNINTLHNVAWSMDSKQVLYTSGQGLFQYDLSSKATTQLLARSDLQLAEDGTKSGFAAPAWAFENQVIFFMVGSSDWVKPEVAARTEYYTFAMTRDGNYWKAVSEDDLVSLSPTGLNAIVRSKWGSPSADVEYRLATISR